MSAYAAAIGTILGACVLLGQVAIGDWLTVLIAVVSLAVLFRWKVNNPLLIVATAVIGLIAFPFLQPPADWTLAADMAREVLKLAPAGSQTAKVGNFVLGISAFQMVADMDKEATSTKSCPMAQQMKKLLEEAGPALLAGKEINEATIAPRLSSMDQFLAHVNSQIKAYCK